MTTDSTPPPNAASGFTVDLLCVGIACYDLIFTVDQHPEPDEKITARDFMQCGGGTAANAAVAAARLGHQVAYAGYLGHDLYGQRHVDELAAEGIDTQLVIRGEAATSLSSIFVKPDGSRSIVNYQEAIALAPDALDLYAWQAGAVLVDGHYLSLARTALDWAQARSIPTVIDADRVHAGSVELAKRVDYLVASERFARDYTGETDPEHAALGLLSLAPRVVITLGERGLVWRNRQEGGRFPAFAVEAVDTTGAGDAFHGAFAAGVAAGYPWNRLLAYASATGALCTTVRGARPGMPHRAHVMALMG